MRLELRSGDEGSTTVRAVLSERNLLTLLTKLYQDDSARTIHSEDVKLDGRAVHGVQLVLSAEPDHEHYDNRGRSNPPGRMHPLTEQILKLIQEHAHGLYDKETP